MPRAYSYIRFSTPEQAKGDSFRRQTELSKNYAEDHGLILDTSLNLFDQGLSGFTSENRRKGALGLFLRAVEAGRVTEGSYLLVESLDRLSRDKIMEQITLFTQLINAGIIVVTLKDNQVLKKEAINQDPMLLMLTVVGMLRANDESETKSSRVRAAWAKKRTRAREEKLSAVCPGWLALAPDRKRFTVRPERVALVRRMFAMNAGGIGQLTIARTFNQEKIPVWGRGTGWHMSTIQRILHSRAVLGEFQPCYQRGGERVPDGEPIADYYPAVVDLELWQRVQRGDKPLPPGPTGPHVSNLFSGLIFDGYTGTSMRHISRRSGTLGERLYYLVSDYARLGTENKNKATSWRYDWFEALFLNYIIRLDWSAVAQEATPQAETATRTRLAAQQAKHEDIQRQLQRLSDALATTEQAAPQTILAKIAQLEKESATVQTTFLALAKEAAAHEARRMVMQESGDKIKTLVQAGNFDARLRLREEIRRKIKRLDVFAKGVPEKEFQDYPVSAPGAPSFKITFVNQSTRWVINSSRKPGPDSALLDTDLPDDEVQWATDDEHALDAGEILAAMARGEPIPGDELTKDSVASNQGPRSAAKLAARQSDKPLHEPA